MVEAIPTAAVVAASSTASRRCDDGDVDADLEPRVDYDKSAVKDFVNQLAEDINQDPVDATVVPNGSRLAKQPGNPAVP